LRRHCEDVGRDYEEIERTCAFAFDVGENSEKEEELIGQLRRLSGMAIETVICTVPDVDRIMPLEVMPGSAKGVLPIPIGSRINTGGEQVGAPYVRLARIDQAAPLADASQAGGEAAPGGEAGSGVRSQADARLRPGGLRQDHASE